MPDGSQGASGIPTQLVIPPGTSDEDRRAIEAAQVRMPGLAHCLILSEACRQPGLHCSDRFHYLQYSH